MSPLSLPHPLLLFLFFKLFHNHTPSGLIVGRCGGLGSHSFHATINFFGGGDSSSYSLHSIGVPAWANPRPYPSPPWFDSCLLWVFDLCLFWVQTLMHVQMFSNTIALPPSTPKGLIQHNRTLIDCQWCCVKLYLSIKKHAEYNTPTIDGSCVKHVVV